MVTFVRQARVWKRLLAFALDLYLSLMLFSAFLLIVESEMPGNFSGMVAAGFTPLAMAAIVFASVFVLLYHVFSEWTVGQTIGMMLFGITVAQTQKKTAQKRTGMRFWQALVRNLFILPFFPFTILWVVEPMYYMFRGERLLEHWTETQTVEV